MQGKTITTYLINGNPNGLKTIFVSNKICKALVVPRTELDKLKTRDEAFRPSLYFLINEDEVYIGESENFYERIKNHAVGKGFWNVALQIFSQNNDLTKSDVQYLEFLSVKLAKELSVNLQENKQTPKCPNLPEHQKAFIDEFFDDVKLIVGFLGYNFFEKTQTEDKNDYFYCTRNGIDAKGIYKDGKFVILKGSKIKNGVYESKNENHKQNLLTLQAKKKELIGENFIAKDNLIILNKDIICSSPSQAASLVIGNSANGWVEWKDASGQTLDEKIRKSME